MLKHLRSILLLDYNSEVALLFKRNRRQMHIFHEMYSLALRYCGITCTDLRLVPALLCRLLL